MAYTPLWEALLDAIDTMIMRHVKPKIVRFSSETQAVLYADAYFMAGDRRIKLKDAAEMTWDADASNLMEKGWGFVLHCTQGTFYGHGSIPGNLMGKFTERKAKPTSMPWRSWHNFLSSSPPGTFGTPTSGVDGQRTVRVEVVLEFHLL